MNAIGLTQRLPILAPIIALILVRNACSAKVGCARHECPRDSRAELVALQRILRLPLARGAGGLKKISEELRRAGRHSNQSSRIGHNTKVDGGLTHSGGCRLSVVVDYTSAGVLGCQQAVKQLFHRIGIDLELMLEHVSAMVFKIERLLLIKRAAAFSVTKIDAKPFLYIRRQVGGDDQRALVFEGDPPPVK